MLKDFVFILFKNDVSFIDCNCKYLCHVIRTKKIIKLSRKSFNLNIVLQKNINSLECYKQCKVE